MFTVTTSVRGMPCVELDSAAPVEAHKFLRSSAVVNWSHHPACMSRVGSGAFLQGAERDYSWTLVEFWQPGYAMFVEYLNTAYLGPEF